MFCWPSRRPHAFSLLAGTLGLAGGGCDFFQELESDPNAQATDTDTDTDTDGPSGGASSGDTESVPCEIPGDDYCLDQDTVLSCNPADGVQSRVDCPALCGSFVNFSCVGTATGQHACWCVEPGSTKVLSCSEVEQCIGDCEAGSLTCAEQCFGRTEALTIRIYGALVHCAQSTCRDRCLEDPAACSACIDSARQTGSGGCSLERAVCDDDRNPEDPWP